MTSIVLPLLFLLMGGIGLPGGAVYIETWRLRSANWVSAVSLAGPASNLLLAVLLGLILRFSPVSEDGIWPGLAFLALLQVTAVLFNMIPIPPFDGYGAIRPHLPQNVRSAIDAVAPFSMWIVIALFWYVPAVSDTFWLLVGFVSRWLGIPLELVGLGYSQFQFWK